MMKTWLLLVLPGEETWENTGHIYRNPIYMRDNKMVLLKEPGCKLGGK